VTMIPTPAECTARRFRASSEIAPGRVKLEPAVSQHGADRAYPFSDWR
jgi:hypothetical protein